MLIFTHYLFTNDAHDDAYDTKFWKYSQCCMGNGKTSAAAAAAADEATSNTKQARASCCIRELKLALFPAVMNIYIHPSGSVWD